MSDRAARDLIASTEFEGGTPSQRAKDLVDQILAGSISADDAVAAVIEFHRPRTRYCYWTDESYYDTESDAYRVILVSEGVAGYSVAGLIAGPLDEARQYVTAQNIKLGLSDDAVLDIRASSMAASNLDSLRP